LDFVVSSETGHAAVTAGDAEQLISTNGDSADAAAAAAGAAGDVAAVTLTASVTTATAAAADDSVTRPSCFCGVFCRLITWNITAARCKL